MKWRERKLTCAIRVHFISVEINVCYMVNMDCMHVSPFQCWWSFCALLRIRACYGRPIPASSTTTTTKRTQRKTKKKKFHSHKMENKLCVRKITRGDFNIFSRPIYFIWKKTTNHKVRKRRRRKNRISHLLLLRKTENNNYLLASSGFECETEARAYTEIQKKKIFSRTTLTVR